jgi:hypothetical protein
MEQKGKWVRHFSMERGSEGSEGAGVLGEKLILKIFWGNVMCANLWE